MDAPRLAHCHEATRKRLAPGIEHSYRYTWYNNTQNILVPGPGNRVCSPETEGEKGCEKTQRSSNNITHV